MRTFPTLTLVLSALIGATIGVITVEIEKLEKRIRMQEASRTLQGMQHESEVE